MCKFTRSLVAIVSLGLIWACKADRTVVESSPADKPIVNKPIAQVASHAIVVFTIKSDGQPVRGAVVEFVRESGRDDEATVISLTDEHGQVDFECVPQNIRDYYRVRAWKDDIRIGSWANIPITVGRKEMMDLPTGGNVTVTGSSPLPYRAPVSIPNATEGGIETEGSGPKGD